MTYQPKAGHCVATRRALARRSLTAAQSVVYTNIRRAHAAARVALDTFGVDLWSTVARQNPVTDDFTGRNLQMAAYNWLVKVAATYMAFGAEPDWAAIAAPLVSPNILPATITTPGYQFQIAFNNPGDTLDYAQLRMHGPRKTNVRPVLEKGRLLEVGLVDDLTSEALPVDFDRGTFRYSFWQRSLRQGAVSPTPWLLISDTVQTRPGLTIGPSPYDPLPSFSYLSSGFSFSGTVDGPTATQVFIYAQNDLLAPAGASLASAHVIFNANQHSLFTGGGFTAVGPDALYTAFWYWTTNPDYSLPSPTTGPIYLQQM